MSAILRLYTPAAQYKDLHGSLFDELRKTRFPDDWWDKEGWDGLEDIVEDFGIDTAAYSEPLDFQWTRTTFISMLFDERTNGFFEFDSERALPKPSPGEMFFGKQHTVKSAMEVTWTERLDNLTAHCWDCRTREYQLEDEYDGIIVLEENGETTRIWTLGQVGTCLMSVPDDYGLITEWRNSTPLFPVECPIFDWS